MSVRLVDNVRHDGKDYSAGEVIEKIKEEEAQRLVDLGVAFFVEERQKQSDPPDDSGQAVDPPIIDDDPAKLLDDSYSYDELKKIAAEVGLEFKGNISKKDLIALIIEQDKVDEFFEEEE